MSRTETTTDFTDATVSGDIAGSEILVDHVTKRYPGARKAAVDHLTLEIPAGEIVTLVGPSGCGKTTTLKMINRLIEPTRGRIVIGGDDVTKMNGDKLRRRIGYVIQGGGLFPHMSVAANIAVVPKMLHWSRPKITERVDELLDLVSLDPDTYRNRYPGELSGGQQQRVGVARALAADPPVLLMDEPFGAVDPLTRQRLQDELLRIQGQLNKTIVVVTHDFEEAMKLGDWTAVFSEGANVVQYDSPEHILAQPANEFVEGFIGEGAGLKQLNLSRVREVELWPAVTCSPGEPTADVLRRMDEAGHHEHAVVLDAKRRPLRWPSAKQLRQVETVPSGWLADLPVVSQKSTLTDALNTMLVSTTGAALVTGVGDAFAGVITVEIIMDTITRDQREAEADYDTPTGENEEVAAQAGDEEPDLVGEADE
ncbi:MAG: ATP-binding cassette domain-containing protein [Acidipropionibacterium acidipropionici]|nr:ATP-binding cassette domain-containing protein [Acidipropionibacterium acidipropionici]